MGRRLLWWWGGLELVNGELLSFLWVRFEESHLELSMVVYTEHLDDLLRELSVRMQTSICVVFEPLGAGVEVMLHWQSLFAF